MVRKVGIIGDDYVRRGLAAGRLVHESGAATAFAENANPAKADRFDLRDSEWFVDALAKLGVGAFADVHEFHVRRHPVSADALIKAKLVDENDLDVARLGVEFLD